MNAAFFSKHKKGFKIIAAVIACAMIAGPVLLEIDSLMEQGGAAFYSIDLRLNSFSLDNFSRGDIHEDGLIERVRANFHEHYMNETEQKNS